MFPIPGRRIIIVVYFCCSPAPAVALVLVQPLAEKQCDKGALVASWCTACAIVSFLAIRYMQCLLELARAVSCPGDDSFGGVPQKLALR